MANILLINGSTHENGFNAQLLEKIKELLSEYPHSVSELFWQDIPIFNQSQDYPPPIAVEKVRRAIIASDALFFITPEYNGFCPGGLKNLIDWLSRSINPKNSRGESFIHNRITAVTSAASGGGTAVRHTMEQLLTFVRTRVVSDNACGVAIKKDDWAKGKLTITDDEIAGLKRFVGEFVKQVNADEALRLNPMI